MTTLDLDPAAARQRTLETARVIAGYLRVGLWSAGWLVAKAITLVLGTIAGVFFGLGWCCARITPAVRWACAAVALGWDAGNARAGKR